MSDRRRTRAVLRALVWKEWRQLRMLHLVGGGLCLFLPVLLLIAAAVRRQLLSFGGGFSYTTRDILVDVLPPVMAATWAVLALFVAAQSFAGERAAGTEWFLLGSPVRRRWIWSARVVAATGTIATFAAVGSIVWAAGVLASAGTAGFASEGPLVLLGAGGAAIVLVTASGVLAASLVPLPLAAVLTGLLLAALPLGLGALWGSVFPYSTLGGLPFVPRLESGLPGSVLDSRVWRSLGGFPLASLLSLLLFPAYVVASFRALCTGEPAGRGRLRRAGAVVGTSVGAIVLLFVVLAPFTASGGGSYRQGSLAPSPSRALALVAGGPYWAGPVWLVDTSTPTGTPIREFGPVAYSYEASWSRDGRFFAIAREGGPLGLRLPSPRIEIYDTRSMEVAHSVAASDLGLDAPGQFAWTSTRLVVAGWDDGRRPRLGTVRLADGRARPLAVDPSRLEAHPWALVGPGADGRLYLVAQESKGDDETAARFRLHELDVERATLSPGPEVRQDARSGGNWDGLIFPFRLAWRLSPSGRYWVESLPGNHENARVLDLAGGIPTEFDATRIGRMAWLAGDTLVWGDYGDDRSRLRAWSPTGGTRDLLAVAAGQGFWIDPAPDGTRLVAREFTRQGSGSAPGPVRLWDAPSDTWTEVDDLGSSGGTGVWAGPDTVASWGPQGLEYHALQ